MNRESVKRLVKAKLEEFSPFEEPESLLAVSNNNVKPIDSYIEETIDNAFDSVLMVVPLHLIRETIEDAANYDLSVDSDKVGHIDVPSNFLRLYKLRITGWKRVVNSVISSESPLYVVQRNKNTRGGNEKPIVAINDGDLELYSVKAANPQIEEFKYIPKTERKNDAYNIQGKQEFEEALVEFLVLKTAIDVLKIFEQNEKANVLTAELNQLIESHKV